MKRGWNPTLLLLGAILLGLVTPGPARACPCARTGGAAAGVDQAESVACLSAHMEGLAGRARIEALVRRGEAYRGLGHLRDAAVDFGAALALARAADEPVLTIIAAQSLGYIHFLQHDPVRAEPLLRQALDMATARKSAALAASSANRLGGLMFGQNNRPEAERFYRIALENVKAAADPGLEAAIWRNLAHVLADENQAMEALDAAQKAAAAVPSILERAERLLEIAAEARLHKGHRSALAVAYARLIEAHALLTQAPLSMEDNPAAARLSSLAAGELGGLYEGQARFQEARDLTEAALSAAQRHNDHALLLRWEWQLGRLLRQKGGQPQAIAAYRRAVAHIEAIRQDIPIQYQNGRSSFRETLAPIYLELADMLLKQSDRVGDEPARQALLREARDTVERIKRSELQDYFQDRCIASRSQKIETLSATTAVLYPIILPERLELLVDIGGRMDLKTVAVDRETLEDTAQKMASGLRAVGFFLAPARRLYGWLIAPVAAILERQRVDTLIFAPDGALRLVPIAALWDGERFLVARYAVVTTPGLTLLDPAPLPRGNLRTLVAGLSEPGPVVKDLPPRLLRSLRSAAPLPNPHGVRGLNVTTDALKSQPAPETGPPRDPDADMVQVKNALALPGVKQEVDALAGLLHGEVLFNEGFQLKRFSTEIAGQDFQVVHIASHGYFGGSPEQNFIMAYDGRLDMNMLEALVKPKQFAARPVEMICLSACQTAEGDDRSPLGLTGVALKSGARSALGTLWPVADAAAQTLLPDFYAALADPAVTKAEALRRAQVRLMAKPEFAHPFFWSPFILIGNWL